MILNYIHSDNSKELIELDFDTKTTDGWINIALTNKLEFIKSFLPAFYSGQKIVLFDSNHKQLSEFYQKNDISKFDGIKDINRTSQLLFFTSGSSGFPIGAFKTRKNLVSEVQELKCLLNNYDIKRVVVTVPFVHIYGVLAGLLLPVSLGDVELIVKENFLPYEILNEALDGNTLVVTTPVFIKAMGKLNENKSLKTNLFICSTGPLEKSDVKIFEDKYSTCLMQIFGSTETGGIAYKVGDNSKWSALNQVNVSALDNKLSVSSPFVSAYILDKEIKKLNQPFVTEDIIELFENDFNLVGRSNKIIKIAGKRISSKQIESIIEGINGVNKAIVTLNYNKNMFKSEQISIKIESTKKISTKEIKHVIKKNFGTLSIPFKVENVSKINYSSVGKKIIF